VEPNRNFTHTFACARVIRVVRHVRGRHVLWKGIPRVPKQGVTPTDFTDHGASIVPTEHEAGLMMISYRTTTKKRTNERAKDDAGKRKTNTRFKKPNAQCHFFIHFSVGKQLLVSPVI
jgi:hypothetical protein